VREYELLIDKALDVGLSPFRRDKFNEQVLSRCYGLRVSQQGIGPYVELSNPIALLVYYDWPYPQVVVGEGYTLLIDRNVTAGNEDKVYVVTLIGGMLAYSVAATLSHAIYGQGHLMEVADFSDYALMTNGNVMVYYDPTLGGGWTITTGTANIPLLDTVCNFKGQIVAGGAQSAWHDCDSTFYLWSKIGSADFTPERDGEAGYRRCPYGGDIYHVRRLGDSVVGYSSEGVTLLTPVNDPMPTFRFTELVPHGLVNRGAVDGDLNQQMFLCKDNTLRMITKEGVKELGYRQFMSQLRDSSDILVRYDKRTKNFYIGTEDKTYLYSGYGLTEIPQHPSAVWYLSDFSNSSYMLPATVDDYTPEIVTNWFDMGYRGQKTIATIESDARPLTNGEVAVTYDNSLGPEETSNYMPVNNQGVGTLTASGCQFKFHLRFDADSNFQISYIKSRYKMTDLRSIRGIYAPPPRGQ